ncbi:hypothetical protein AB0M29_36820 [Streptomyces sp. NPDC051976]|uniref:hypothetical protein n=1 Tax=Streptomyces sp. NPDC051976 TaxID=3154947 RepID=UPI003429B0E3
MIGEDLRAGWNAGAATGARAGLRQAGPANTQAVTDAQVARLEEELGKSPAGRRFEEQRWTLARVQAVPATNVASIG